MKLIDIKIAKSPAEYEQAILLVTDIYRQEGYIASDSEASEITKFIHPTKSLTLLAYQDDVLLGTISLVTYRAETGLPMSTIYSEELKPYTKSPLITAEVCQFVVDKDLVTQISTTQTISLTPMMISISLLGAVLLEAYKPPCDFLTFAINPKHRLFYEALGCVLIGQEKSYASVNTAPALAYILDLKALETKILGDTAQSGLLAEIVRPTKEYLAAGGRGNIVE